MSCGARHVLDGFFLQFRLDIAEHFRLHLDRKATQQLPRFAGINLGQRPVRNVGRMIFRVEMDRGVASLSAMKTPVNRRVADCVY